MTPGYTTKVEVYREKTLDLQDNTPTNIVLDLARNYFGKGHTIFVYIWYTSLNLAEKLIQQDTHLVGPLRKNWKNLPQDFMTMNLKPGVLSAKENENGITVMKWKCKQENFVAIVIKQKFSCMEEMGPKTKQKRFLGFCNICLGNPHLCRKCFDK
ncbi:unnamed protein product [Euphydryas editha]|uniref:PiggyBac transposable element-derived protein domain-containing protein n=1 Tax=Euphydryas editha TaxID=104508 RepID=A0AAU9UVM4_EUPED|nr:unnamed protein product [Euphydryas editha]